MPFNTRTVQSALQSVLATANTTTAANDLSASLVRRVQIVEMGRPANRPLAQFQLPAVLVYAKDKDENYDELGGGTGTRRRIITHFGVLCAVMASPFEGGATQRGHDQVEEQLITLTTNVETVLRNDINLSATVSFQRPMNTEYHASVEGIATESTYVDAAIVTVEAESVSD